MNFEYDLEKSLKNKEKHGIDFEEAQRLWEDKNAIVSLAKYKEEQRRKVTGKIGNKLYTAIVTYRNGNIRLISVRHTNKNEEKDYNDFK